MGPGRERERRWIETGPSFEQPTADVARPISLRSSVVDELPAGSVGRYVVLALLGRGGMGRVLRAYDPKLQREVALKEVRKDALEDDSAARLVVEARAMAKLSHPNVVSVYDVELADDGGVVIVMEYVPGETLRQWCKQVRPWEEVVARFVSAGRGLSAAHDAGVLHRDFKPENVLVTKDGAKVTDFGLAKSSDGEPLSSQSELVPPESGDSLEALTTGGTILGTPCYMAPEHHAGDALTPAADQYGFCVALWEALCGKPPFRGSRLVERKRQGPPSWPSNRGPRRIGDALRRGLDPDPQNRWPSVRALLDVLEEDPAGRWTRRLLATTAIATTLGAAGASYAWAQRTDERCAGSEQALEEVWSESRRADLERVFSNVPAAFAESVWTRTRTELERYATDWVAMHSETCAATTIRGEQSVAVMDLRMSCLQRARTELAAVTAVLATADVETARNAHELVAELPSLSVCEDVAALQAAELPPEPEEAEAVSQLRQHLADARALRIAGRYEAAATELDEARRLHEGLSYGPVRTELALAEAWLQERRGRYDDSRQAALMALESAARWQQWVAMGSSVRLLLRVVGTRLQKPDEALQYRELARGLAAGDPLGAADVRSDLASMLVARGQYPDAEREFRAVLDERRKLLEHGDPRIAGSHRRLGHVLSLQGRYEEAMVEQRAAIEVLEAALGEDHPNTLEARSGLAANLSSLERYDEAFAEFSEVLEAQTAALGAEHPEAITTAHSLGIIFLAQGKHAEAEAMRRQVLAGWIATMGADHPRVAMARSNLANAMLMQGRHEEAKATQQQALLECERAYDPEHPSCGSMRANLGSVLEALGRPAEAEEQYRRSLAIYEKTYSSGHPNVAMAHNNLGTSLLAQSRYAEAEAEFREALTGWTEQLGAEHPRLAVAQSHLATSLFAQDQVDEARELATLAWKTHGAEDAATRHRAPTAFVMARLSQHDGDVERARSLAEIALAGFEEIEDARVEEVQTWLGALPTASQ